MNEEIIAAALVKVGKLGLPADVQELLVYGNASRGIPAGILGKLLVWAVSRYRVIPETSEVKTEDGVEEILAAYRERINETPALLSLLYDAGLLPEQIVSRRGARSMAAVIGAYEAGLEHGKQD